MIPRTFKWQMIKEIGYLLYCFRVDHDLSESEMLDLLRSLMSHPLFKKEYKEDE
jgi:hypothetical protein